MKPPFEIYRGTDIADANGHVCTAENPEIALEIVSALNGAAQMREVLERCGRIFNSDFQLDKEIRAALASGE